MKKTVVFALIACVLVSIAACSAPTSTPTAAPTGSSTPTPAPLEKYDLKILTAGDQPPEQQLVFDEIAKLTKDTLNVNISVQYFPWADYLTKMPLMSAAKEKFDIVLNFGGLAQTAYERKEMVALDDLLPVYGKNLLEKIYPSNWVWAKASDGKTIAVPCQYAKDGIYTTFIYRKDLRVKYGLEPITDMATLSAYLDAVAKNEKDITPLFGGSMAAAVQHDNEKLYSPIIDYGIFDQGVTIGIWETTGADAYKVKDYYSDDRAKNAIKWGSEAMNRGWYAKDLNVGADVWSMLPSGKVACQQMDYYNFNTFFNNTKQVNPGYELEWGIVNKGDPVPAEQCNNFAQISATSADPARAVMFLDWIQASQDNYDLWYYGIKGKHYTLGTDGSVVYPEGSVSTALPYAPTPWWFRNKDYDRSISTDCDLSKTAQQYWKDTKVLDLPDTALFVFDKSKVELEVTQIYAVVKEYWNDLSNGVLQGDDEYQKFLKALSDAGMPAVLAEMQTQLDAFRAK